jgi:hypothetical protein
MEPLAVDLLLLRSLETPALRIVPGRAFMARVVNTDGDGRGSISLAGLLLEAELPKTVRAGQELRLLVRDVSADRVLLSLSDQPPAPLAPAPVPLPGGGGVSVSERDGSPGSAGAPAGEVHTVALRYDAPSLGAVELQFRLDAASLQVSVVVANGEPLASASGAGESLRQALADSVERTVTVTVQGRHEPLDVYA